MFMARRQSVAPADFDVFHLRYILGLVKNVLLLLLLFISIIGTVTLVCTLGIHSDRVINQTVFRLESITASWKEGDT